MEKFVLTNDNYYSKEANEIYFSVSQFKDFDKCEIYAMDKLKGLVVEEKTEAQLFGGYVDAYFSHELDNYLSQYGIEMKNSRTGELKATYKNVDKVIQAITSDPFFYSFHKGKTQQIYVGKIENVLVKGKFDFDFDDMIVDQKIVKDLNKVWVEDKDTGRNVKTDFIEAYDYHIQGGVYQELKRQRMGTRVPFIIAATTKEEEPDKALIQIDQEYLDKGLNYFKSKIVRYDLVKRGLAEPIGCGNCQSCRRRKKITRVELYSEYYQKGEQQ